MNPSHEKWRLVVLSISRSALALLLLMAFMAQGQTWPTKPVRIISPFSPGSATDVASRLLSAKLTTALGQPFVVENIPGASGIPGAQTAARAAADGYTVFFAPASNLVSNPLLFKSLPYDPARDFAAVAMVVDSGPFIISVNPDVPVTNLAELIAHIKSQPGKHAYAVDVSSGFGVILGKWFAKTASLDIEEISYRTNAQAIQDTVSGRTLMLVSSVPAADPMARAGKLRRLAISSSRRFPGLNDLPTMAETVPGLALEGWFALMVPTGTTPQIIERLNREVDRALSDPTISQRLLSIGLATSGAGTPQSTTEFIRLERERWNQIVKVIGLEPQ
jgi:tripartite-type tricarboxylate transporter receptor subunit TctC